MGTLILAVAMLVQPADPVSVTGVVVDPSGKPVPDVEVVLAARKVPEESVPTLSRATTDAQGAFRLEFAREKLQGLGPLRVVWAYRPGRAIAMQRAEIPASGAAPTVRLTLAEPVQRTVTIRDPDGRQIGGVRLAPRLFAMNGRAQFLTPDDWQERLTVATGLDGVATFPYVPANVDPLRLIVTAPGLVPHEFPLPDRPGSDRFDLEIGRPARLAGSVNDDEGRPAANVLVEVAVRNLYYQTSDPGETPKPSGPPQPIHFDSGPILTGADGSFRTPPQLMTGRSYQITVHPEGDPPVLSGSLTATNASTTVPPLRVHHQPRRKLIGLVRDRQGRPVAGARVFLPSGEPSTTTDAEGRYQLEGILPEKTYLLVQAAGFRLQGWPSIPAGQPQERTLTLIRTSEPSDRTMAPLPAPIPAEEARALARRVLEPYVNAAMAKGDDRIRWNALGLLSQLDPARALEWLEKQHLQTPGLDVSIRYTIAAELLAADPVEAESVIAAIASPGDRAWGYASLAEALSETARDRKRGLLERATVQVRAMQGDGRETNPRSRVAAMARVAGDWLDLGEVEQARPLIRDGLEIVAALPPPQRHLPGFLPIAARLEADRVLILIRDLSPARRRSCYVAIAEALAGEHPAEAERVFRLIDDATEVPAHERMANIIPRLCWPMAKADPGRARRLIAELKSPRAQACAWALLALGLADRDRPAARSALDESIRLIDGLGGPPDLAERMTLGTLAMVAANPAASILPIVERVAPDRLEETFWKAVARMPKDDLVSTQTFLARYDRQVADALLVQTAASASPLRSQGPDGEVSYAWRVMRARVAADPRAAVAMFEALPPAGLDARVRTNQLTHFTREALVTGLLEPLDEHWKYLWRRSGIPIDQPRFR
jgi:hypothetical protein